MTFRKVLALVAIGVSLAGGVATAQTVEENQDADALAADMRLLAANPLDIEALITAGEITLRMGDTTAAAAFFGRAEKLDPNNPRVKTGMGSLMVRAERPGEALRRFADAEARGGNPRRFAADRGLAYDLIGEQDRAQRDYRLALRAGADDEVSRRYALSLGISGEYEEAFRQLEPLLKRGDRAAWRDRAFILAMKGDLSGAQKIANSMMSPGLGAGLAPFFQRLPLLGPADRAFAVTFGELRSTPERVADARLAPRLPRLGPDPDAPRAVEVAAAPPVKAKEGADRGRRRRKGEPALAPTAAPPVEIASSASALPPPPGYVPPKEPAAPTVSGAGSTAARTVAPPTESAPSRPVEVAAAVPSRSTPTRSVAGVSSPSARGGRTSIPAPEEARPVLVPAPAPAAARPPVAPPPAATASSTGDRASVVPASTGVAPITVPPPAASPVPASPPRPGVADQPSASEAGVTRPNSVARVSEDSVLARIIAGIDVPGSELGVAAMPERPRPAPAPAVEAEAQAKPARQPDAPAAKPAIAKDVRPAKDVPANSRARDKERSASEDDALDCVTPGAAKGTGAKGRRPASTARSRAATNCKSASTGASKGKTADADTDALDCVTPGERSRSGAKGKATSRGRAGARSSAATTCKADGTARAGGKNAETADTPDCPKPDARGRASTRKGAAAKSRTAARCVSAEKNGRDADGASTRGEPARIWVQVAGGANEATLEKAWTGVKAKAPDLFRGRQGWSTPLRATNRVLTGPFKSSDEAQAFVNQLTKAGLSGFVFTSTKGQKVERLGGK